jgi:hypothetical protein
MKNFNVNSKYRFKFYHAASLPETLDKMEVNCGYQKGDFNAA